MSDQQIPPADELYAVREQIKALDARERILRALMITDPASRTGNKFAVELKDVTTRQVDLKELRAAYPTEVEEHTHPITRTYVELRAISEDGEITRISRKAKETAQ